jgi:GntR family transcriptional regulator/MocR family aminotransferase
MPKNRTNPSRTASLVIDLDREGGDSLHRQIESSLRDQIRTGRLAAGVALPPTRTLAIELGVSRGIVVEAYSQLVAEGYLRSRTGGATTVAELPSREPPTPVPPPRQIEVDFGYGRTDVAAFPRRTWLRSMRRAIVEAPDDRLAYPAGNGTPELRRALADYLNRARGTDIARANLVVSNGYVQGLGLLLEVLAARGAKRIAVEDPSPRDAREHCRALGLEVVGIPLDGNGVPIRAVDSLVADALVITPSHQWPTGGVLCAKGRAAIIDWARRTGALVIEDDYDAEFRYDRTPIGALQGLAPDQVAYIGTASKTLAPGIRLGWLALPPALVADFAAAKLRSDRGSSTLDQLAFADFLESGEFDRHLRRMRAIYRERHDALVEALTDRLPGLRIGGAEAGLHLVAWLPDELDEDAVVAAAAARDVKIVGVGRYRLSPDRPGGLLLGYSDLGVAAIRRGVDLLAAAIKSVGC